MAANFKYKFYIIDKIIWNRGLIKKTGNIIKHISFPDTILILRITQLGGRI